MSTRKTARIVVVDGGGVKVSLEHRCNSALEEVGPVTTLSLALCTCYINISDFKAVHQSKDRKYESRCLFLFRRI
jgi:hypothetical protein